MSLLKCNCGNTVFENISTYQFDEDDFIVRGPCLQIKPEVLCIPVLKCIACGRLHVPSTSLIGKNHLDPAVKAYAQLLDAVEKYNDKLDGIPRMIESLASSIASSLVYINNLEDKVNSLFIDKDEGIKEEVLNEQTGKRGRKKS